jgi:small subunit ribosomal protein S21
LVIRIQTRDNEPVDKALRRLRKLCNNEGVTRTAKAKAYFEKPSERRRRDARERRKAIRLSMRAKRQDVAKLLNRRRKARKNARAAAREMEASQNRTEALALEAAQAEELKVSGGAPEQVEPTVPAAAPLEATVEITVNTEGTPSAPGA